MADSVRQSERVRKGVNTRLKAGAKNQSSEAFLTASLVSMNKLIPA